MVKELQLRQGGHCNTLRYIAIEDCLEADIGELNSCFLSVSLHHDDKLIRKIAEKLFSLGCRDYSFVGSAGFHWETEFDMFDCDRDVPEDDWATTSVYETLRDFAEMLDIAGSSSRCLFIYDNTTTLLEVQHLLLDIWEEDS